MGDDADGSNWTETPCGEEPPCHLMNVTEWERTWWRGAIIGKHRAALATDVDAVMARCRNRSTDIIMDIVSCT